MFSNNEHTYDPMNIKHAQNVRIVQEHTCNLPRGTTTHVYKCRVCGPPRPNHNKQHACLKTLNERRVETQKEPTLNTHQKAPRGLL